MRLEAVFANQIPKNSGHGSLHLLLAFSGLCPYVRRPGLENPITERGKVAVGLRFCSLEYSSITCSDAWWIFEQS